MPFIHFLKDQLTNLDFSLKRETLQANNLGAYCSSTLINCNTRKYHGLLVLNQPQFNNEKYVFVATLDESILQESKKTHINTNHYPNIYFPKGYTKYEYFSQEQIPSWLIQVEDIKLKKEILLLQDEEKVLIKYSVIETEKKFKMQFNPLLAFRNIHCLSKLNNNVITSTEQISNGQKIKLYSGFSSLYLQFSKKNEFTYSPDWYKNFEYEEEKKRGYDYTEDLFSIGIFETTLKKGDQLIFSAGLNETTPSNLNLKFDRELKKKHNLNSFKDCLENSAKQFITIRQSKTELIAGFHWFGCWGRDTFISLPGITLSTNKPKIFKEILNSALKDLKDGLLPNVGIGLNASYNSADSSLWFIWSLQQYAKYTNETSMIWREYGNIIKSILENYRKGTKHNIHMIDNGLLFAGEEGYALTWMDAIVDGFPVTPRIGLTVELNALWYNAICFALETAAFEKDKQFIIEWENLPSMIKMSFKTNFWDNEKGYLADYTNGDYKDWAFRPNQIFAVSLPYTLIGNEIEKSVVDSVKEKLLTPRGLRTLASDDKMYNGTYQGNQKNRDYAYHQGTAWPWLLGHFSEAYIKVYKEKAYHFLKSVYENFAPAILDYGLGTIAEIYDGDKPHHPKGAISQAWSVAELLRMRTLIADNKYMLSQKNYTQHNN
jgi:predicted glycogen debranching enzyme